MYPNLVDLSRWSLKMKDPVDAEAKAKVKLTEVEVKKIAKRQEWAAEKKVTASLKVLLKIQKTRRKEIRVKVKNMQATSMAQAMPTPVTKVVSMAKVMNFKKANKFLPVSPADLDWNLKRISLEHKVRNLIMNLNIQRDRVVTLVMARSLKFLLYNISTPLKKMLITMLMKEKSLRRCFKKIFKNLARKESNSRRSLRTSRSNPRIKKVILLCSSKSSVTRLNNWTN